MSRELRKLAVSLAFIVVVLLVWLSGVIESYLIQAFTDAMNSSQP
jgi:hypothetical protein